MKNPTRNETLFVNRDHVVSVRLRGTQIVVTTTGGERIDIRAVDDAAVEQFADELANNVQSNFVEIAAEPRVIG